MSGTIAGEHVMYLPLEHPRGLVLKYRSSGQGPNRSVVIKYAYHFPGSQRLPSTNNGTRPFERMPSMMFELVKARLMLKKSIQNPAHLRKIMRERWTFPKSDV